MNSTLFITNLADSVSEGPLRELFSQGGRHVMEVAVVRERNTGKSRGFAFIELVTSAEAATAIQELNGHELDGRAITVQEARSHAATERFSRPHHDR